MTQDVVRVYKDTQNDVSEYFPRVPVRMAGPEWVFEWEVDARHLASLGKDEEVCELRGYDQMRVGVPDLLRGPTVASLYSTTWDGRRAWWLKDFYFSRDQGLWRIFRRGRQWGKELREMDFNELRSDSVYDTLEDARMDLVGEKKRALGCCCLGDHQLLLGSAMFMCEDEPVIGRHRVWGLYPRWTTPSSDEPLALWTEDGRLIAGHQDQARLRKGTEIIRSYLSVADQPLKPPSWWVQPNVNLIMMGGEP